MSFGWVCLLISSAHLHVRPMGLTRRCADGIKLTPHQAKMEPVAARTFHARKTMPSWSASPAMSAFSMRRRGAAKHSQTNQQIEKNTATHTQTSREESKIKAKQR